MQQCNAFHPLPVVPLWRWYTAKIWQRDIPFLIICRLFCTLGKIICNALKINLLGEVWAGYRHVSYGTPEMLELILGFQTYNPFLPRMPGGSIINVKKGGVHNYIYTPLLISISFIKYYPGVIFKLYR